MYLCNKKVVQLLCLIFETHKGVLNVFTASDLAASGQRQYKVVMVARSSMAIPY